MITQKKLKELMHYDPETGIFVWRKRRSGVLRKDLLAGCCVATGYIVLFIDGKHYQAHRMAWLYAYGELPPKEMFMDHINRDRADNRLANLRVVTPAQNARNISKSVRNSSGRTGISWHKGKSRWQATIRVDGTLLYLGAHKDINDAIAARVAAEKKHGFTVGD